MLRGPPPPPFKLSMDQARSFHEFITYEKAKLRASENALIMASKRQEHTKYLDGQSTNQHHVRLHCGNPNISTHQLPDRSLSPHRRRRVRSIKVGGDDGVMGLDEGGRNRRGQGASDRWVDAIDLMA
jgi:hypothetical protein